MYSLQSGLRSLPLFMDHMIILPLFKNVFFSGENLARTSLKLQEASRIPDFSADVGISLTNNIFWDTSEFFFTFLFMLQGLVKTMF